MSCGARLRPQRKFALKIFGADCWGSLEEAARKKRGRPRKDKLSGSDIESPIVPTNPSSVPTTHQIPRPIQHPSIPQQSNPPPTQASPPKPTPTKAVVKALPTVRDHTTDQLGPEGDEYIPREIDPDGEKKVTAHGRLLDGREYKCRTFLVPNRGDKLFMLATECARVLTYRDSYLLFNKNRSLYKIIATQHEKDDLIQQEILPYSYRSRQIAIVTAKSMFRQFGSRLVANGRRVRDDYWEAKARKQGFTEEDLAGEKRPGGAKAAREAHEAAQAAQMHQDIVYSNGPGTIPIDAHGHPQLMQAGMGGPMGASLAPLPMIHLAPSEEMRLRGDYGSLPRGPRQEMTGIPYQDKIQPSSHPELMGHSSHTADFNKMVNAQAKQRNKQMEDFYKQPRDITNPGLLQLSPEAPVGVSQPVQANQTATAGLPGSSQQPMLQHQTSQMIHQGYQQHQAQTPQQQQHQQQSSSAHHHASSQSPVRNMQPQIRPEQMQHHPSSLSYASSGIAQPSGYGYPQSSQLWGQPPPQPHQSPLSSHHGLPQYQTSQASHGSPHPSQSPHQHSQSQPQLQHSQSSGSLHGGMAYSSIPGMAQGGYNAPAGMYRPQQSSSPHAYMQHSAAGGAAGAQTWAPSSQQGHGQSWTGY